jgi:two-component system phosphate regulon sensor histidine kinase PhoR
MRMKRPFLIGLSALALLVLVSVQYFFIKETYTTKKNLIDGRYGALVSKALSEYNDAEYNYAFDSVLYILDNTAVEYLYAPADTFQRSCGQAFQEVLDDFKEPGDYIRESLRNAGEDPEISYILQINELFLIDLGFEQQVYPDSVELEKAPARAILAGSYTYERNFFRVSYDVYINFTGRTEMILREMWLILSLSVFTLVLVFLVFYLTFRNLMQEKRLSLRKTDFINNMTHELKTPLSTISVASSSLGKPSVITDSRKVEELSAIIKKQNRHLTELIDRILDINIWERDQVKLKKKPVKVEDWIGGLAAAFKVERGGDEVHLDLVVDFPAETVLMDEVHLSTAVNNLLTNAVKYCHSPCRVRLVVRENPGTLVLEVSDNGPGIRKEDLKHIFEKFYRGQESTRRVIRGLGLGLYYVKQIVEAHGGSIAARSTPGKGAQFIIKIPIDHGNITG